MTKKLLRQMPLVQALLEHAAGRRQIWHMPGHKAGRAWPAWLSRRLASLDVTELPTVGNLNHPDGAALQAMTLAAHAFGAGLTRFITGGSTGGLQILLAWTVGRRGRLIVPTNCHQAIIHAAGLLDLQLTWLKPTGYPPPDRTAESPRLTLLAQVTAADVARALAEQPDCRAVLITSPDYYGGCADIRAIAAIVHAAGALLLVDEAHGAHLAFAPGKLPPSALAAGADACVQSGHKTTPVLTQGAYLHVAADALANGRLAGAALDRMLPVWQTSSPSWLIAATLDWARAVLAAEGQARIDRQLDYLTGFAADLPVGFICQASMADAADQRPAAGQPGRDPLRLVLTVRDSADVRVLPALSAWLTTRRIDIEMADLTRLVLIPSLWHQPADWHRLSAALKSFGTDSRHQSAVSAGLLDLEQTWRRLLVNPAQAELTIGAALLAEHRLEQVKLEHATGRIAASCLAPYPPGIPLIRPGERLDGERVDFLRQLLDNKINTVGIDQEKIWVIA
jgi:arginine decarboxylase